MRRAAGWAGMKKNEIGRTGGGQRGRSSKEVGYAFILYATMSGRFAG